MTENNYNLSRPSGTTPQELWALQQITDRDVDYNFWNKKRASVIEYSPITQSCIFLVDVFKARYDYASEHFSHFFGYNPSWIKTIQKQGDLLEERIHPDDRDQLTAFQLEHGQFIYSLDSKYRNDYQQIFQFRMLDIHGQYINVISRHQVYQEDRNGKAWIILGVMDISPDQTATNQVKRTVVNRKTGEILKFSTTLAEQPLTKREKEILLLIRQGLFSKEIADRLRISIHTVHNHRKNILTKLNADNALEAISRINSVS